MTEDHLLELWKIILVTGEETTYTYEPVAEWEKAPRGSILERAEWVEVEVKD